MGWGFHSELHGRGSLLDANPSCSSLASRGDKAPATLLQEPPSFSRLGCPEAFLQKAGLSARHGTEPFLQQAPRPSAKGSSPPGRCENASHQPTSGLTELK